MIHEFTGSNADQIIGHHYERFQAFVTCVFLFVVLNNLLGLVPGIVTPTSAPVVPLGIALCTFVLLQLLRVQRAGLRRLPEALRGPHLVDRAAAVSHRNHLPLARVMSLTIRLYANMFASDLVTLVFFSLVPVAFRSSSWDCMPVFR